MEWILIAFLFVFQIVMALSILSVISSLEERLDELEHKAQRSKNDDNVLSPERRVARNLLERLNDINSIGNPLPDKTRVRNR